eukprot:CAMPEP_0201651300 /NCGR_PEP_ID=MMETSP0493-20130528/42777_1 /ASSEMBLY_ACC=CAM_ASM_000838 /TAXON_ID=420259 /ORGANISM="Thalassiosira gravida, Strain GMp14c1" /LENGTH=311 /DNA_ID=CAMNT_0048127609 /DNA_START=124 /DNA_END=1059 /DNA_ORIENTATION=-
MAMTYSRHQQPSTSTLKMAAKTQPCKSDCACGGEPSRSYSASPQGADLLKVTSPSDDFPVQKQQQTDNIAFVDNVVDLNKILDDDLFLAVWRQANAPMFVRALSDPSIQVEDLPMFEGVVSPDTVADVMKEYLADPPYKLLSPEKHLCALDEEDLDELVDHIEQLVDVFANISREAGFFVNAGGEQQLPSVHVKLRAVGDNACRYWHQDCVPFRMITTYRGPCTEWVLPALSKKTLARRQFDSEHAQSLSHHDVALFKGRGDTDGDAPLRCDAPGVVHRSPRTEGSGVVRLVLVLDIPDGWRKSEKKQVTP